MNSEQSDDSSRDKENSNRKNDDDDESNDDIETELHSNLRNDRRPSSSSSSPVITPYAIPLTRRNVTRIPVALPIRWNQHQHDPPTAEPDKPISLPPIAGPFCIMGTLLVTFLAWSLIAAVTFGYGYVLWNSVLFLFGEGVFYDWVQKNVTVIEVG